MLTKLLTATSIILFTSFSYAEHNQCEKDFAKLKPKLMAKCDEDPKYSVLCKTRREGIKLKDLQTCETIKHHLKKIEAEESGDKHEHDENE